MIRYYNKWHGTETQKAHEASRGRFRIVLDANINWLVSYLKERGYKVEAVSNTLSDMDIHKWLNKEGNVKIFITEDYDDFLSDKGVKFNEKARYHLLGISKSSIVDNNPKDKVAEAIACYLMRRGWLSFGKGGSTILKPSSFQGVDCNMIKQTSPKRSKRDHLSNRLIEEGIL